MNVNEDYQIAYARVNPRDVFVVTNVELGHYYPLVQTEPVGIYTMDPKALYAGHEYLIGIRPSNINLVGMLNQYHIELGDAIITKEPLYYADLNLIIVGVKFKPSVIPTLDEMSLPGSLWTLQTLYLYINDIAVIGDDGDLVNIPISFDPCSATISGDKFYNSDRALMVVQPGENILLDLVSGGGAGAGVSLIKANDQSGNNGGDVTLCYIDPVGGEVKPIVFIEGGLGGRHSTTALQNFKPRAGKIKVFNKGFINQYINITVIEKEHNLPISDLESTIGGVGHVVLNGVCAGEGGLGGYVPDVGYRGEGGMSGGRVIVQIEYNPMMGTTAGPFIILHPKTMVNIFGVVNDKSLKIKKTKKPLLGGKGGASVTKVGDDGQNGTLIVSNFNG